MLVTREAPDFTANAVYPDFSIAPLTLSEYRGKYVVLFFYPMDFTFVCPSETRPFKTSAADETAGFQNANHYGVNLYLHLARTYGYFLKLAALRRPSLVLSMADNGRWNAIGFNYLQFIGFRHGSGDRRKITEMSANIWPDNAARSNVLYGDGHVTGTAVSSLLASPADPSMNIFNNTGTLTGRTVNALGAGFDATRGTAL